MVIFLFLLSIFCGTQISDQSRSVESYFNEKDCSYHQYRGLFNLYKSGNDLFLEVPDRILGRNLKLTNTILRAPAQSKRDFDKRYGYSGDFFGPVLFQLKRNKNNILFLDQLTDRILPDSSNSLYKILSQRGNERVYFFVPIIHRTDTSSLIDMTSLLKENPLFGFKLFSFEVNVGMQESGKFSINRVISNSNSIIVDIQNNYFRRSPSGARESSTWRYAIAISAFNDDRFKLNPSDKHVGYFARSFNDYSSLFNTSRKFYAKRWRLELTPKDSIKYFKGILVEPVNPILFYIDRDMPRKWIPYFKKAVNAWQSAFQQAGYKNAIIAKVAPSEESDPNFSEADPDINYITWKISGQKNAFGPSPINPVNGEITSCHIGVYSGVLDALQRWYFVQCGMSDKDALKIDIPDKILGRMLQMVVSHEIGHSLGLEHNFYASSSYSVEQLKDDKFLSGNGISPSIMDYVRCNYILENGDKVSLNNRIASIGVYDRFAIEWGYRIFPGKNDAERDHNRELWLKERLKNPYNTYINGSDVMAMEEDLSNDHVRANTIAVSNLRSLVKKPVWTYNSVKSYNILRGRYEAVIQQYKMLTYHVIMHIGGHRYDIPSAGYISDSDSYRDSVIKFISDYLLCNDNYIFDNDQFRSLDFNRSNVKDFIVSNIPILVGRYKYLNDSELRQYLRAFRMAVFDDWINYYNRSSSDYSIILKEVYIDELLKLVERSSSSNLSICLLEELNEIAGLADYLIENSVSADNVNYVKLLLWRINRVVKQHKIL